EFIEPEESVEITLAEIWTEVLPAERVGLNDNFFALGGDSLLAAQVISRIRKVFQIELPLKTVFRDPTLAGQALSIKNTILDKVEKLSEDEAQNILNKFNQPTNFNKGIIKYKEYQK
ncbi:unnamed protein product, partial [marine sediment metagenome]